MRVGCIPYLNCEPFFAHLAGFDLTRLPPRKLGEAVATGALDAGPLSLVDYLRLESMLVPLPFGIATAGPARSVILFSERAPAELTGAVIGVTDETSTSVELLRVLLAFKLEVAPRAWVGADEPCDAVLLIGDRALRALRADGPSPYTLDVGREWTEWTELPAVFARWGVRRAVAEAERRALERALDESLARGLETLPQIAARRRDTGLGEAEVVEYLRGFTYRLGAPEERAVAEFTRLRAALPPAPRG